MTALGTRVLAGFAGLAIAVLAAGTASAQNVNARQDRQQARIEQGIRSGQLTPREAWRLERRSARIAAQERRMRWRNGGYLTPRQRYVLNNRLDRTSRAIYRQKRDWQRW